MDHEETLSDQEEALSVPNIQLARYSFAHRDSFVKSSALTRKPKKGQRRVARAERNGVHARRGLIKSGEFAEYHSDLRVVSLRTVLDPDRTPAMQATELQLWDQCTACHKDYGVSVYRWYLAKRIERLETKAYLRLCFEDSASSFVAFRRQVAILVQERVMLDMEDAALKAAGFDGAFVALGRSVLVGGFKEETGWYTEREFRAYCAVTRSPGGTSAQADNLVVVNV